MRSFVDDGYMVRAFADSATQEARELYFTRSHSNIYLLHISGISTLGFRRDEVIKAGAHLVATDYPGGLQSSTFNSSYTVELAGGNVSVCNPRSARASCQSILTAPRRFIPRSNSSCAPSHPSLKNLISPPIGAAEKPELNEEIGFIEEDRAVHVNVISVVLICCIAVNIISLLL